MFGQLNARIKYRVITDEERLFDKNGEFRMSDNLFEMLDYFSLREDGGIYSSSVVDLLSGVCKKIEFGEYMEFSEWGDADIITVNGRLIDKQVSFDIGENAPYPYIAVFRGNLKKGMIIYTQRDFLGEKIYFDFFIKDGKAFVGTKICPVNQILKPSSRIRLDRCVIMYDVESPEALLSKLGAVSAYPNERNIKMSKSDKSASLEECI